MSENATSENAEKPVERRRARLPQPDFSHYKKQNAWPGPNYFFVGHSFNLEEAAQVNEFIEQRANAINSVFVEETQWAPVDAVLNNQNFSKVLSRFENDFLHRLDGALIGPAIDSSGKKIADSFTIWRKEMRRQERESA
ncbi:MAG: hypothetical protein JST89_23165 [Cyanobacteria bacterium SZAS-4]|nr:hypothetical protein [Cyanobacteria bacterium SZAS-4]